MSNERRSYLSQLFTAYNKAKASARRSGETKLVDRLNKALGILMSRGYYSGEKATYQPSTFSCGCQDWKFRNAARRQYTGACKHMLAEGLLIAASSTNFLWMESRSHVSISA